MAAQLVQNLILSHIMILLQDECSENLAAQVP